MIYERCGMSMKHRGVCTVECTLWFELCSEEGLGAPSDSRVLWFSSFPPLRRSYSLDLATTYWDKYRVGTDENSDTLGVSGGERECYGSDFFSRLYLKPLLKM